MAVGECELLGRIKAPTDRRSEALHNLRSLRVAIRRELWKRKSAQKKQLLGVQPLFIAQIRSDSAAAHSKASLRLSQEFTSGFTKDLPN